MRCKLVFCCSRSPFFVRCLRLAWPGGMRSWVASVAWYRWGGHSPQAQAQAQAQAQQPTEVTKSHVTGEPARRLDDSPSWTGLPIGHKAEAERRQGWKIHRVSLVGRGPWAVGRGPCVQKHLLLRRLVGICSSKNDRTCKSKCLSLFVALYCTVIFFVRQKIRTRVFLFTKELRFFLRSRNTAFKFLDSV